MASLPAYSAVVRFGVFEADLRAGELRRNGVKVRLQDLPFRALTYFLAHPGIVITRDELRQALWPRDVFVDFEQGISSAIMRLRDALGDSAENPVFIQTVERRGYRWIAPIHAPEAVIQESPAKQPDPPAAAPPQRILSTRLLVYALPVVVLTFAIWMLRPVDRSAQAGAKSTAPPVHGPHQAANREAEDLYLKGRFYWNKRTPESLNQAVDAFTQAIVHDPNYSDAYVGLADCYNLMREFSAMPANEAYLKAFAAAKKAVELDPQSSAAHTSLAFVTYWGMWDAPNAENEFRRALELDPNNAQAHHWYATFLHSLDRHSEALAEIELARKLDPNSLAILADRGELLLGAGQHDQGIELLRQLETSDPNFVSPHRYLRFTYFNTGDYPHYIAELKQEGLLTHDAAMLATAESCERGFARGGERGMFEAELAEQKKLYEQGKLSPFFVAQTDARLGNIAETLKYLNLCVQSRDQHAPEIDRDPLFASFRDDAAFRQLVAQVKPVTAQ